MEGILAGYFPVTQDCCSDLAHATELEKMMYEQYTE